MNEKVLIAGVKPPKTAVAQDYMRSEKPESSYIDRHDLVKKTTMATL